MIRAGVDVAKVLTLKQIGTMPEEPDVTKSSEVRVQKMMEDLQTRDSQVVPVIHGDVGGLTKPTELFDAYTISVDEPEHLNKLMGKLRSQLKGNT